MARLMYRRRKGSEASQVMANVKYEARETTSGNFFNHPASPLADRLRPPPPFFWRRVN